MDKIEEAVVRDVARYGWSIVQIPEDRDHPGWAFTIGLYRTFGHPELTIFGLSEDVMQQVLNSLAERIRAGEVLKPGQKDQRVFQDWPCQFQLVQKQWYALLFGYATRFYQGDDFPLLQVVWGDIVTRHNKKQTPYSFGVYPLLFYRDPAEANIEELLSSLSHSVHTHDAVDAPSTMSHHGFKPSEWPFQEPENASAYTTVFILDRKSPILGVLHDSDGSWQFLSGDAINEADVRAVCLGCIYELDKTIGELAELPVGWEAWRPNPQSPWERNQKNQEIAEQ